MKVQAATVKTKTRLQSIIWIDAGNSNGRTSAVQGTEASGVVLDNTMNGSN